jgi:putative transposase
MQYRNRRSIRMPSFDYRSSGYYFVTICTKNRNPYFLFSALRSILDEQWHALPVRYPNVTLDSFVIMPDHVHFIVHLRREGEKSPSLFDVVGSYKSLTMTAWLRYIEGGGINESAKIWQLRFYDHIIRNEQELQAAREYIENNPIVARMKWEGSETELREKSEWPEKMEWPEKL